MGITIHIGRRKKPKAKQRARKPKLEFAFQDEPVQTGPPVWNVYADDHDGEGFHPVGEHHGDPRTFDPWGGR